MDKSSWITDEEIPLWKNSFGIIPRSSNCLFSACARKSQFIPSCLHTNVIFTSEYKLFNVLNVANEEYYQLLMINESQPSGLNVSSYTVEEVETITSEYIMKNAVSMLTPLYSVYVKCFLE